MYKSVSSPSKDFFYCPSRFVVCSWTLFSLCAYMYVKSLLLFLILCDPVDCTLPGSSVHWHSLGKNTGMGCHTLLQEIFHAQGLNPCCLCILHWQVGSFITSTTWVAPIQLIIFSNFPCDFSFEQSLFLKEVFYF